MNNETTCGWTDLHTHWFGTGSLDDADYLAKRVQIWFSTNPDYDAELRRRFGATLAAADHGACDHWSADLRGALSLVLLFDQLPRNIHRGTRTAFAFDQRALALAKACLAQPDVASLSAIEQVFLHMPLEHAEDLAVQDDCVAGYRALHATAPAALKGVLAECLAAGEEHREVIRRFGRFPHRNAVLGRRSTAEERAWIDAHHGWGQGQTAVPGSQEERPA